MDGLGARCARHLEDAIAAEIAFARGRGPDAVGLVAGCDVQRTRIGLGIDSDGADAEATRGARDAAGDLATVGDEDLVEHQERPERVVAATGAAWTGAALRGARITAGVVEAARQA